MSISIQKLLLSEDTVHCTLQKKLQLTTSTVKKIEKLRRKHKLTTYYIVHQKITLEFSPVFKNLNLFIIIMNSQIS